MIITPASLNGLFTQFDTRFSEAYAKYTPKPWFQQVAMTMPSRTAINTYAWLAKIPAVRQWLGARQVQNLETRNYTLTNLKYELTLGVQRTVLEDDQFDTYGPWIDQAAYQAQKWPDRQLWKLLDQGNSANFGTCFDGQNFFSNAHPIDMNNVGLGTQTNYYASGKALTWDNYAAVRTGMMALVGEDGNPLGVMPDLLVVPPALEAVALQITQADYVGVQTVGGNTQVGTNTNVYKGSARVLVIPELANSPTVWYLMDTRMPVLPLIWQLRTAPEFVFRNQLTDEHVFSSDEFLYGIRMRGAPGYGLWFLAARAAA